MIKTKHGKVCLQRSQIAAACGLSVAATFAFAVPHAVDDSRSILVNSAITINVLANDFDDNNQTLTVNSVSSAANGRVTLNSDGSVSYEPNLGFVGSDSFSYSISNTASETATATITVAVVDVRFRPLGETANNQDVGGALDALCSRIINTPTSTLSGGGAALQQRCEGLYALALSNPGAVDAALRAIAPEEVSSQVRQASASARSQTQAISQRQAYIANAASAISINGLALTPETWRGGSAGADDGSRSRLNFFMSAQLEDAKRDQTDLEAGYKSKAQGLTLGADYRLQNNLFFGLALAWSHNKLDFASAGGDVDTDIYSWISYLSWSRGAFTLDAQAGLGTSTYDTHRHIQYDDPNGGVDVTAKGNTSGSQWLANLQLQWDLQIGGYSIRPFARADYLATKIDGYGESGSAGWEIELSEQKINQLSAALGTELSYAWSRPWGVILPQASLSAVSELQSSRDDVTGHFAFDVDPNNDFVLQADSKESLFYLMRVGSVFVLPRGFSSFMQYQYMLGYAHLSTQQISAGLRYEF